MINKIILYILSIPIIILLILTFLVFIGFLCVIFIEDGYKFKLNNVYKLMQNELVE